MSFKNKVHLGHVNELLKQCTPSRVMRMMASEIYQNTKACQGVQCRQQLSSDLIRFADAIANTERSDTTPPVEREKIRAVPSRIMACRACAWRGSVRMTKTIEGASTLHCPRCEHRLC